MSSTDGAKTQESGIKRKRDCMSNDFVTFCDLPDLALSEMFKGLSYPEMKVLLEAESRLLKCIQESKPATRDIVLPLQFAMALKERNSPELGSKKRKLDDLLLKWRSAKSRTNSEAATIAREFARKFNALGSGDGGDDGIQYKLETSDGSSRTVYSNLELDDFLDTLIGEDVDIDEILREAGMTLTYGEDEDTLGFSADDELYTLGLV